MDFSNSSEFTLYYLLPVTLLLLILHFVKTYRNKWKDTPPGPWGLPIIGFLPFVTNKPFIKMIQLGKKYGDIFSLKLGSKTVVVLNSGEVIREAFSKPELLGRPDQKKHFVVPLESPLFNSGEVWVQHRRFTIKFLKENDAGTTTEFHILAEIENLMKLIDDQDSKPFALTRYLTSSVSNYMSALIFGKRYEFSDPDRQFLDKMLDGVTRTFDFTRAYVFFPWLKKMSITRKVLKIDELNASYKGVEVFTRKKLEEHKNNADENRTKDFLDFYLSELSSVNKTNSTFSESLIADTMQILYGAGSETIRTSLGWGFYTMAVYQDVQEKVQKEIDEIIGNSRNPLFSDQKSMPYTQSVIMELQRWQTVVPLGGARMALDDVKVAGYRIPKGTFVLSNLWAAHRDPRCWDNPEKFIPNRFLSADTTQIIKNINYMPFSFGKRNCPGEKVAVVQMFLYFTSILQRFKLRLPENTKPNFDGEGSFSYVIKPHKLCFVPRVFEAI